MPAARPDAYQLAARAGASAHGDAGASQRSAGSLSQCSSQDGAVLGRFPKPSAPFRTPAATPSLSDGGLVQSLLRQQVHCEDSANVVPLCPFDKAPRLPTCADVPPASPPPQFQSLKKLILRKYSKY